MTKQRSNGTLLPSFLHLSMEVENRLMHNQTRSLWQFLPKRESNRAVSTSLFTHS